MAFLLFSFFISEGEYWICSLLRRGGSQICFIIIVLFGFFPYFSRSLAEGLVSLLKKMKVKEVDTRSAHICAVDTQTQLRIVACKCALSSLTTYTNTRMCEYAKVTR